MKKKPHKFKLNGISTEKENSHKQQGEKKLPQQSGEQL